MSLSNRLLPWFLALLLVSSPAVAEPELLTPGLQREIVAELAALIEREYVVEAGAGKLVAGLESALASGTFASPAEPAVFIDDVNRVLQASYPDRHLAVLGRERFVEMQRLFHAPRDEQETAPDVNSLEGAGISGAAEINRDGLNQVGYIAFSRFNGSDQATAILEKIFATLSDSERMIIDLRESRGGDAEMVKALSDYFFAQPMHLVTSVGPKQANGERPVFERITSPNGLSPRYAGKPLDILISEKTFSAAESFAFGMNVTGRARLIGEATGGGGHMNDFFPLPAGLGASVSVGRTFDPRTGMGWEGTGVLPEVAVAVDHAMSRTLQLITEESGRLAALDTEQLAVYRRIQDYADAWYTADGQRIDQLLDSQFEASHHGTDSTQIWNRQEKVRQTQDGAGVQPRLYHNRIIRDIEVSASEARAQLILRETIHKLRFRRTDDGWLLLRDDWRDKAHHG